MSAEHGHQYGPGYDSYASRGYEQSGLPRYDEHVRGPAEKRLGELRRNPNSSLKGSALDLFRGQVEEIIQEEPQRAKWYLGLAAGALVGFFASERANIKLFWAGLAGFSIVRAVQRLGTWAEFSNVKATIRDQDTLDGSMLGERWMYVDEF